MYLFKNFYLLNPKVSGIEFFKGSILVKNGNIVEISKEQNLETKYETAEIIDGKENSIIMPGLIQSHIHLCQTMHRNKAEEMPLITWLQKEIWPFESSLDRNRMGKSVIIALKEIIASGTTAVLDMGTVHEQETIFEIVKKIGLRYTGGKAMMDATPDAPANMQEKTETSIKDSMDLYYKYNNSNDGLINYALCPRFALSCSNKLLQEVRKLSDQYNIIIHTHASEHPDEVAFIKEKSGYGNIAYLENIEALNNKTVIAHAVHLDNNEREIFRNVNFGIAHCPATNLKLGSGVAPISSYLKEGRRVGIGADGAPCNNTLNLLQEMKLASLLQKGINNNPTLTPAEDVIRMATISGADILGKSSITGSLEIGKNADMIILNMDTPQTFNWKSNPSSAIVYGADASNITSTMVKGRFLYRDNVFSKEFQELEQEFSN